MTSIELLEWWQSRHPEWASVTAPLVRHFVESTISSVPLKTVLRLSFVRSRWQNESIRISNAATRLSNIYDCSTMTIIEDLQRVGIQPLAEFVRQYPAQSHISRASMTISPAASQTLIQDVMDFDVRLREYHRANESAIQEAITLVEASCPTLIADRATNLSPDSQDDLCFEWSYYLAIADALEPDRHKLIKFVKPESEPPKIVAEKCANFYSRMKELIEHSRRHEPPQVLRSWLDEVETWMQSSKLAFPDYESFGQSRKRKQQHALLRFEQLLDATSRRYLSSIGEFTLEEESKDRLKVTFTKLKEFAVAWAPLSLQVMIDRKAKKKAILETDKLRMLEALHRFTTEIKSLQSRAIVYARSIQIQLYLNGSYVTANDLTDEQLLESVKKLTIHALHPRPDNDEPLATLTLDCDWDLEHGVCFGLMSNGEIIFQP